VITPYIEYTDTLLSSRGASRPPRDCYLRRCSPKGTGPRLGWSPKGTRLSLGTEGGQTGFVSRLEAHKGNTHVWSPWHSLSLRAREVVTVWRCVRVLQVRSGERVRRGWLGVGSAIESTRWVGCDIRREGMCPRIGRERRLAHVSRRRGRDL
jgi:hypothetical protein